MRLFAKRIDTIQPFYVMEVLARARALEAQGKSIIHMEIGEPDFPTAKPIVDAGVHALQEGHTHYTPAMGLTALREQIARHYDVACRPDMDRVVITPGASGGLQLVFAAILNPGDQVLLTDPGYPCNRNFVRLYNGEPLSIPVDATTNYQLTPELIRQHWTPKTRAVLIASPANPTGTIVATAEMADIVRTVEELGGVLIVDEIYQGLTYSGEIKSALEYSARIFIINSFSKYFGMTGWRVGWMVVPDDYIPFMDKLAQNLFIATGTVSQHAALAALSDDVKQELEHRRDLFQERRDYLQPALQELGFVIPVSPSGAFYIYADCSGLTSDSQAFAMELLEQAGVALTPGRDFGVHRAHEHVRFSYANTLDQLQEGVRRIQGFIGQ